MWLASPLRNCPSRLVGIPSLEKSVPHFKSIVLNSKVFFRGSLSENLRADPGDMAGLVVDCVGEGGVILPVGCDEVELVEESLRTG